MVFHCNYVGRLGMWPGLTLARKNKIIFRLTAPQKDKEVYTNKRKAIVFNLCYNIGLYD